MRGARVSKEDERKGIAGAKKRLTFGDPVLPLPPTPSKSLIMINSEKANFFSFDLTIIRKLFRNLQNLCKI